MLETPKAVEDHVRRTVASTPITDIHTHLFPPSHGQLLLWGADELLTYHYLVAELFTIAPRALTIEKFWALPKPAQADLIWEHVFQRHGALSEAARGVLTTFNRLGLDTGRRDLPGIRKWFAGQKAQTYLPKVFELANVNYAVMTNNPFLEVEAGFLDQELPCPDQLKTALRIDSLLVNWKAAAAAMKKAGYKVRLNARPSRFDFAPARKFLADWTKKLKPQYFAASLPPDFAYPYRNLVGQFLEKGVITTEPNVAAQVLDEVVLPAAIEAGVPFAMMIGVRKAVNPPLGDGGDGVGACDLTSVMHLCQKHPQAKFLVTVLSRVNQHELAVLARKFGNLHVFGCWWFCNNPSIIREIIQMRLELLGATFTAQHSDARVLDQVIYKWAHTRKIAADVLSEKYAGLFETGWRPTEAEIARDVRALFGGAYEEFLGK